ncbi:hypothetical protein HYALB_00008884 [Hymenoscyphus albidus]|uniref:Haloacid dehalogenase n=1 Tax=Hymenoscyphus albidus TaxID=595503 RepID=A0A9N9Q7R1_9HELO|nr:hypothetical protein HYALB_00008884 [Hymenoscyphus albidus]
MTSTNFNQFTELPKALLFDVFGTTVNWRKTVVTTLIQNASIQKVAPSVPSTGKSGLPQATHDRLHKMSDSDWGTFAQEWRNSYKKFTREFVPGESKWQDVDTHHHHSLISLLKKRELEGVYTDQEVQTLSQVWHYLEPWADTSAGLEKLGSKMVTSSLSNGNPSLLQDLNKHGKLGFKKLQSSADFEACKPHPKVYLGAVKALGLQPREVAMVAAHLNDLKAARDCGLRTIYVERREEEDWKTESEEYRDAMTWVDMWVSEQEDGFVEVAKRLGVD